MNQQAVRRFYEGVARRIAECRETAKPALTQEALAARTPSLSRSAIANIESYRQRVALHQLVEIATALGLSIADFLPEREPAEAGGHQSIDAAADSFLKRLSAASSREPSSRRGP